MISDAESVVVAIDVMIDMMHELQVEDNSIDFLFTVRQHIDELNSALVALVQLYYLQKENTEQFQEAIDSCLDLIYKP